MGDPQRNRRAVHAPRELWIVERRKSHKPPARRTKAEDRAALVQAAQRESENASSHLGCGVRVSPHRHTREAGEVELVVARSEGSAANRRVEGALATLYEKERVTILGRLDDSLGIGAGGAVGLQHDIACAQPCTIRG